MKRLSISIDGVLDDALAAQVAREGTSKSAWSRRLVAEQLGRSASVADPLDALVGSYDEEPGDVDQLVYGP